MAADTPGTVYLICFDIPIGHHRHYRGWTRRDVAVRFQEHMSGRGARLTRKAVRLGIGMEVTRTWPGTPMREKQLKLQGGASRQCPRCHPMKRMYPEGYPGRRRINVQAA